MKRSKYFFPAILVVLLVVFVWIWTEKTETKKVDPIGVTETEKEAIIPTETPVVNSPKPIESGIHPIGEQVYKVYPMVSKIAKTPEGDTLLYVAQQGFPSVLTVMDATTLTVMDVLEMPGATAVWALDIDADGNAWVGTTPDENLYQYVHQTKEWKHFGKMTTKQNTMIGAIHVSQQTSTVYGTNSYQGAVFTFKDGKASNLGRAMDGRNYGRSIVHSDKTKEVFVGVGSKAGLVAWNPETGEKRNILPKEYQTEQYVYDLNLVEDVLFAKLNPSQKILMFDIRTHEIMGSFEASSRGVSPKSPLSNVVYYTFEKQIFELNLQTKKSTVVSAELPNAKSSISLGFIEGKLFGMQGNSGEYFLLDLTTKKLIHGELDLPNLPIEIYSLHTGLEGNIYSSGFVSGGIGIYHPNQKEQLFYSNIGQMESSTILGDKLYIGSYPNAKIYVHDPANQHPTDHSLDVIELMSGELNKQNQDRPTAMAGVEKTGKLYIGTFPKSGFIGGSFAVYDVNKATYDLYANWISNHSIVSLRYHKKDELLYGGTSIYSGKGNNTNETNAKLFTISPTDETPTPTYLPFPISGIRTFEGLMEDNTGQLWGFADGYIFSYQRDTGEFRTKLIDDSVEGYLNQFSIVQGKDGLLYGNVGNKMVQVNSLTMEVTVLKEKGIEAIASDSFGNVYFKTKNELFRYEP